MKFQITEQDKLKAVDQEARSYIARKTGKSTNTITKAELSEASVDLLAKIDIAEAGSGPNELAKLN
jgi:hypothetical protein